MDQEIYDYYSNVRPKNVEWFWYPYIPLGKLTVLQGDPGDGKSTFVLNLIALLTSGRPMPDGYVCHCAPVAIYQCAEDGKADTIKPRLEQAGADCDKNKQEEKSAFSNCQAPGKWRYTSPGSLHCIRSNRRWSSYSRESENGNENSGLSVWWLLVLEPAETDGERTG